MRFSTSSPPKNAIDSVWSTSRLCTARKRDSRSNCLRVSARKFGTMKRISPNATNMYPDVYDTPDMPRVWYSMTVL